MEKGSKRVTPLNTRNSLVDRRTLPPEPRHRCKTLPPRLYSISTQRSPISSANQIATSSAHRDFFFIIAPFDQFLVDNYLWHLNARCGKIYYKGILIDHIRLTIASSKTEN